MKNIIPFLIFIMILSVGCRMNYDIEEVATPEHLGETPEHDHDQAHTETEDHHEHVQDTAEASPVDGEIHDQEHVHDNDHDEAVLSSSDRHVHEAGARNHGTAWFFNQPWAASFIWGKMIRDTVILALLAAVILVISRFRIRKKH